MKTWSLYELNAYIKRVVQLNFQEALWITAELAKARFSRGHLYLELVEKEEASVHETNFKARAEAVLWQSQRKRWERKNRQPLEPLVQEGMQLRLLVEVDFHEQYGLKLHIKDLDPVFTLGQLALQRKETLQQLQREGLLDKNSQRPLPIVFRRIAVISSATAAGLEDFLNQLQQNPYGYEFFYQLFEARMQGRQTGEEIVQQLQQIANQAAAFDLILLLRGGGARLDLLAFDGLPLAQAIAQSPLPVVTGIGHQIDETVADRVAHTALKTPTAVAEWLIQHNAEFESGLLQLGSQIVRHSTTALEQERQHLQQIHRQLPVTIQHRLKEARWRLDTAQEQLQQGVLSVLQKEQQWLEYATRQLEILDPDRALKRGFSLTTYRGKVVNADHWPEPGDQIETLTNHGRINSTVKSNQES